MHFSLTNARADFQALVNNVLRDNIFVFIYNILIFPPDLQSHQQYVYQVLQHLLQHNLYAKLEKCEFHTTSVSFLG